MDTGKVTDVNSIGLALTALMCLLVLVLPRRYALFPVLVLTCFMSMGQKVVLVGLEFTMIRILVVFGWVRLVIRGEIKALSLTKVDKAVIYWITSGTVLYFLLWQTSGALINRLGHAYDTFGLFFLFRYLIRDREDVDQMARMFALCMATLAGFILSEKLTGRNQFAVFGYVPLMSVIRDGVIRCQGPFSHPILAGTFASTNMPYFVMLWYRRRRDKLLALLGFVACVWIAVASGSSGPVMAFGWAFIAFFMWRMRKQMRLVRWGISFVVIALQLVMKAPVWFLLARVSVFDGSTGFFRAYLIDSTIKHFGDWWLAGTESTAVWGRGLFDVTNEYIAQGVNGGLLTMVLFILIISRSFGTIGRAVRMLKGEPFAVKFGVWALGGALLAHVASYFSVSYFDQNIVTWFLLLSIISTIGVSSSGVKTAQHKAEPALEDSGAVPETVEESGWVASSVAAGV